MQANFFEKKAPAHCAGAFHNVRSHVALIDDVEHAARREAQRWNDGQRHERKRHKRVDPARDAELEGLLLGVFERLVDLDKRRFAHDACNLELEYALEYLMQRLEEAGVADKTCIVLTNDHYPYGLTEDEYNELAGQTLDTTFEKYRNSFICYVPGLSENIVLDEYCSTADILPTLLNLFGVDYDSRLLAGTDVLSSGLHVAVLSDKSFLTKTFRYDAGTETVIPADENTTVSDKLAEAYRLYVDSRFQLSGNILNSDYYAHVFSKESSGGSLADTVVFTDIKSIFQSGQRPLHVPQGLCGAGSAGHLRRQGHGKTG